MRDTKRIPQLLNLIKQYWKKKPDQRFGQLLINCGYIKDDMRVWSIEDDELIERFEELLKR